MYDTFARVHQTLRVTLQGRLDSLTMSGPPKRSSPSEEYERLFVRVQQVRQQAEEFQRTIEDEIRHTRAVIDDLRVRQEKRRDSD